MVAVIGDGDHEPRSEELAEAIGALIAEAGYGLVCGGLGGVMEAACRGARGVLGSRPGPVVAILPGREKVAANAHADVVIPTGMGYARNLLVVLTADAIVAVGGASGTLSEIAHAWQLGKPICALAPAGGWAARLAGETLDSKRTDAVFEAQGVEDVAQWLENTLGSAPERSES